MAKIVRNKIFEDPDTSYAKDNLPLQWDDNIAHPFGMSTTGEVEVGPPGTDHAYVGKNSAFAFNNYEGRIWPQDGVIAFWEAPPKKTLEKLFNKLIMHDEISVYQIEPDEIHDFLFDIPNPDQTSDNEDAVFTWSEYPTDPNLKTFHLNRPEHTVSPMLKKGETPKVGGSFKYAKEKPLKFRQALVPESLEEAQVGLAPIADTQAYMSQMAKGVNDKIDFISKIDPGCILDFGCADGYILNAIHKKYPNIEGLVGYDLDEEMVKRVQSKYPNIDVTDNWKEAVYMATEYDNIALSLMSVIHEVYSYGTNKDVQKFWRQQVFNPQFKYVIIRDMMPSKEYWKTKPSKRDIHNLKKRLWRQRKYKKSFEKQWGKITANMGNMLHWLLKYDYKSNWGREVKENYLPVSIETVKSKIPQSWKIIYEDYYVFQPVADKVMKDFGIELQHPTHVKMIIENPNAS